MIQRRSPLTGWLRRLAGVFAFLAPAATLYGLTAVWPATPDGLFHLQRVRALAEALRWGVLYPRWFPDFAFGYGYPVLNFYAPAFYYPPALLHLAGLDILTAVRVTLAIAYALSGLGMYALFRDWMRPAPAALGAILYLVYPYHLYDLFVRGALPEFVAFLWPPLIVWTTLRWLTPGPRSGSEKPAFMEMASLGWAAAAALSWAGLILTHNLTALMAALAGLGLMACWIAVSLFRWRRGHPGQSPFAIVAASALPLLLGAGLSAVYALPALVETKWVGLSGGAGMPGYLAHFSTWRGLFDGGLIYRYPEASQPMVPAPGYAAVLLILAMLALLWPDARGGRVGLGLSATAALGALWLTTSGSAFVWAGLGPLLGELQFPWRWQLLAAFALACAVAWLAALVDRRLTTISVSRRLRMAAWVAACALGGWLIAYGLGGLRPQPAPFAAADLTPTQMWEFDAQHGQVGASWTGEFLPRWVTEQRWAIGREPSSGVVSEQPSPTIGAARVLAQSYLGERLIYDASAAGTLIFHSFYYPAWRVTVDGQAAPTRAVGDLGLLAVDVPAGQHEVVRRWGATPTVRIGRLGSVVAWFAILGLLALARDRRRRLWIGIWLAAAALVAASWGGWLERTLPTASVRADYGTVRLESALAPPARAGETAVVTLYWLVTGTPEPLTAFVHVVAADGRMVAGYDAPLGGAYTPASRWRVGELIPDRHPIPLPADLPAGVYQLKAGLYRPGAPEAPLTPEGSAAADPRVEIGLLEVRP